ncbi:MAG TPA: xanthine dehydrogenase family protein molybdopterin-binding subunit [Rubrivivax sp.]|nr:xanthine dehydrogenase family protein molybdopterin-binding subunit [Rubrivivax sp.]
MKKRHFMLGTLAAAGALTVGWSLLPPRGRMGVASPGSPGLTGFNGWLKVSHDNRVTVTMPKSEMGQGIHTALAMVLADEMDADWAQIGIEPAPIDNIYNNISTIVDGLPFHPDDKGVLRQAVSWLTAKTMREVGTMVTGGSSSVKDLWLPMREAGASARAMLVAAAAQAWNVPAGEISARAGVVRHASGRQASFGELATAAATLPVPTTVVLKQPAQFTLIGKSLPRIEATAKIQGTARFGMDVLLTDMLYATVVMCPTFGGAVRSFDAGAALKLPGVKEVVGVPGFNGGTAGVALIADTPWHALQAIKLVQVNWAQQVGDPVSSASAMDKMAAALDRGSGFSFHSVGDVDAALAGSARVVRAEYRAPFVAHHTLEPQNCTVLVKADRATVWAPTQVPGFARWVVAQLLGLDDEAVDMQVQLLGGGFGRRLEVDFIVQAAAIARHVPGRPVQTFWTREEDTRHDFYRPAAVARMAAGLDAQGSVTAWQQASAGPSIVHQVLRRLFDVPNFGFPDKTTAEGAFDQPYEWPHARVGHVVVETAVPVGFWRSVGHSHQAFFKESFIDELAHAAQQDPVAFRASLLARQPRQRAVLERAAQVAGWGGPLAVAADGAKKARGVALHRSFGSTVVQIAEVSLAPDSRTIRVHRVVCVIDCGTAVNPGLIRQQMESGIVFGLSAALHGGVTIENGQVQQSNFHDQPLLRIDACPVIETEIMASSEPPEGVGEPGTPPIAPAVANALFALTGQRLRSLPLKMS